ncbi:hypothetical protein A3A03_03620 [Candidatus Nomurabacteria bacterium RIFCSPLOWO2_01_FULL_40_18]|uniref:Uncharacterized protein n=1 Tax=Candidatus Nomurabacteria bacterium RIFCSPLOWO2_01_FULL_40_18 TaxID=1801773 RepID=A0A1F6XIF0_9BACT|nr:MAG: hypothetical protein A3A03_03620 [Candidatus Nomurabacteria bacterium RIFCSPLOWO2_01_FULL_40_18]
MKKSIKKTTEKYLTKKTFNKFEDRFNAFEERFESSARATAKSFADNAEVTQAILTQLKNINEVTVIILKEIKTIHEDNKYFRASISNLNTDGISYDKRISDLNVHVEKLEAK